MRKAGFTLAELLIALVLLGIIATFTIPKVLSTQQNAKYSAIAKEAIATISQAYQLKKMDGGITNSTTTWDLTPYMNYVRMDSSSTTIDGVYGQSVSANCFSWWSCMVLHNGARLRGTATTFTDVNDPSRAIAYYLDADGAYTSTTINGSGKSLYIFLYTDGRVSTMAGIKTPTDFGGSIYGSQLPDPPWFSWN